MEAPDRAARSSSVGGMDGRTPGDARRSAPSASVASAASYLAQAPVGSRRPGKGGGRRTHCGYPTDNRAGTGRSRKTARGGRSGCSRRRALLQDRLDDRDRVFGLLEHHVERRQQRSLSRQRSGTNHDFVPQSKPIHPSPSNGVMAEPQFRGRPSARMRPASTWARSQSGIAPIRSSSTCRSMVAICVTLTTESRGSSPRSADTRTLPGRAASAVVVVSTATTTVRS